MTATDQVEVPEKKVADEAADSILHDPPTRSITLMGKSITLRPLPVSYSKRLYKCIEPARTKMSEMIAEFASKLQQQKNKPKRAFEEVMAQALQNVPEKNQEYADMDIMVADTLISAVLILAEFYQIETTKEELNEKASLAEVEKLVSAQLEVNSKEDFLLRSFSVFMETFLGKNRDETHYLNLLSMLASAKSGK